MATVLYVDDEAPIRRAVSTWLTRKGHVVHEAADCQAARAVVESLGDTLQGVFIDLWLGSESGMTLFEWLSSHRPSLAQRVAFVTGDLGETPDLARTRGCLVFTKPFELKDLEVQATRWGQGG